MSKAYREHFGDRVPSVQEFREWLQPEFEYNPDGSPVTLTEQAHKDICDVNRIIQKYDKTGLITHVAKMEAEFGDLTGADFREMMTTVAEVQQQFEQMPARIRARFGNDPGQLLTFMESGDNREEAIRLGLIRNDSDPARDGLGEHVAPAAPAPVEGGS